MKARGLRRAAAALFVLIPAVALAAPKRPAPAAPAYVPGPLDDWQRRTPEQAGLDGALLQKAIDFANASETKSPRDLALAHPLTWSREPYDTPIGPFEKRGPVTGIVLRHGYLVAEWGDPTRVDMTFSVTKSFLSTMVGLAMERGLIRDLDERVAERVPTEHFASEHNARITWDHLLRQTSDWEGTLWGKPDWADRPQGDPSTWLTRPRNEPGRVYKYNDVRVNLLALAALHVWRRPLPQVLKELVMDPIGASSTWRWHGYENSWVNVDGVMVQSVSGGGHWGGGMFISARDQARFGLLTLRRGRWADREVFKERWYVLATTPTPAEPTYGFMNWYLNTGKKLLPSAPESSFAHLGNGTNAIYCDPENDIVVVVRWIEQGALDGVVQRVLASLSASR
jgi:CubicO group peptidase (beta-lactamase class C family)